MTKADRTLRLCAATEDTEREMSETAEKLGKYGHHPDPMIDAEIQMEVLDGQLATAHSGLRRALDFQAGTPNGLNIKRDVRWALRESGYTGDLGYANQ